MRTLPVLLLLTGCWPYLPGPYDDYVGETDVDTDIDRDTRAPDDDTDDVDTEEPDTDAVSDEIVVIGWVESQVLRGSYWGVADGTPWRSSVLIAFADEDTDWDYGDLRPSGCREAGASDSVVLAFFDAGLDVDAPDTISVPFAESGTINLPRSDEEHFWGGTLDSFAFAPDESGSLDIEVGGVGSISDVIFRTPSTFTVTEPVITGSTEATYDPNSSFRVAWSGALQDDVAVRAVFIDDANEVSSIVTCKASSNDTGSVTIPRNLVDPSAVALEVWVSRMRSNVGSLDGTAGAAVQTTGVYTELGRVVPE